MRREVQDMARGRRKYTREFKVETVELVKSGGKTIREIAKDLDLTESSLRNWVRQHDVDAGTKEGLTTQEREELVRLRREVRQLRMERDILKKATAFFAKENH